VFSILGFILLGLVAGYLGRLLMPGRQPMGCVATAVLGMVGSVVGGTLGSLLFEGDLDLSAAGFIGAVIGVLIVLFVMERTGRFDDDRRR
jgi:uncharacterized membrane protein YeaQ/YmgE (transglycosylase-associated protein family)